MRQPQQPPEPYRVAESLGVPSAKRGYSVPARGHCENKMTNGCEGSSSSACSVNVLRKKLSSLSTPSTAHGCFAKPLKNILAETSGRSWARGAMATLVLQDFAQHSPLSVPCLVGSRAISWSSEGKLLWSLAPLGT